MSGNNGNAKTDNFMLGTAELMIGPQADLYDLNPATHSIGLVKNFSCDVSKETTDLTQGIQNDIVFSVTTSAPIRMSAEMYEYTDRNMAHALSLDGATLQEFVGDSYTTTAASAENGGSTDLTVDDPASPDALADGDSVMIKTPEGNVILGTAAGAVATNTLTIKEAIANAATAIPAGSTVAKVNVHDLGDTNLPEYFAVKAVGQLANGATVTLLFPKVKVVSGLSTVFSTQDFNNIPFELMPIAQLPADPFYMDFKGKKGKMAKGSV